MDTHSREATPERGLLFKEIICVRDNSFRVDLISEGMVCRESKQQVTVVASLVQNGR